MKRISIVISILWLVIFPVKIFSQDIDLERIVVTPSRIEESIASASRKVDVITSKDIEASDAKDLAEVLTGLTSVNISNYGGLGATKTIRMRGSTAAQVLVLVDGRPINNPRDGEAELTTISLENIERIEVMHGPGSSLYGSSAMGGAVNILTKNPPKEGQKTELISSFGSRRTYSERMLNGARAGKFGYLISAEYQNSEGFRPNSELNAKDCNLKMDYEVNGENNISLNSGFYTNKIGVPGKITEPDLDDKQGTLKRFFDFNWNFKPDTQTTLSTKIYQNYDRLEFVENSAGSIFDIANDKFIHTTTVRGLDLQVDRKLFEIYRLVCGFNYVKNINDSTSTAKHEYIVRAGYLENHLELFKNLKLNFSARLDDYSNFGTEVSPNFSFLYKFNEDIKFHGLISRSFRAPTFNDLYWPFDGWTRGNPNLKPEKGITGEFGGEMRINKYITSGLTYYRSGFKDLINWAESASVWQPSNVNSAIIEGIESENKLYISKNLEWDIDYTFLRARDNKTHKYLVYQPKNKVDSCLKYNDHKGLSVGLKGQFTDMRFHDAENSIKVKRFYTIGLDVSKKIGSHFTYFVSIDNLLNRKYQVIRDYPMPGFSLTSGLKVEF